MRVLMPGRILDRHVGGNTTYAQALAGQLRSSGVEVRSIRPGRTRLGTMMRETAAGLSTPRHGEEIIHYVADTGPLLKTRRPSLVTVHGIASRWISVARTPTQEYIWRRRVERAIASTEHTITVSKSSRSDIAEVFQMDPGAIDVIPHGIDYERFATPSALSEEVSSTLPKRFLLYLGNLEPRKNIVSLIKSLEVGGGLAPDLPLVIAGKPAWNSEEITTSIARSKHVHYVGFVSHEDRAALMQRCEAFVFPSLYEGFGFPVLEAMAAGAPVVASRRGSLAEVAGPAHEIQDLSAEGIARAVNSALAESSRDRQSRRLAGQQWASEFSWKQSAEAHLATYRKVIDSR